MTSAAVPPPLSSPQFPPHRCVLVSIDGWGLRANSTGNAIKNAKTPRWDKLTAGKRFLSANSDESASLPLYEVLDASGLSVGLPRGVMGNSEVGHLTMGAGRVEYQDLVRINATVEEKKLPTLPALVDAFRRAKDVSGGRLHLLGLVSDGGVHSHIDHLEEFLRCAKAADIPHAFVHFFADGRDTPPSSGTAYVERLQSFMRANSYGAIATLMGRFYAMDRDKRWERIKIAFDALCSGEGERIAPTEVLSTLQKKYALSPPELDEFIKPLIVDPEGTIRDNDTLIFFDFRSDRMREITAAFTLPAASLPFQPIAVRKNVCVVQMTQYDEKVKLPTLFPPQSMDNVLSEWISKKSIPQFHTAETEKYAHVTFFFAGGREAIFAGEEREMIPSPKVATYDLSPKMAQMEVAKSVERAIASGRFGLIVTNFAAPDMVGHTGKYDKAVEACEACDEALGVIEDACAKYSYSLVVTADHGNAEEMVDENGNPKTSHTTNFIPIVVKSPTAELQREIRFTSAVLSERKSLDARAVVENGNEEIDRLPVAGLSCVAPTVLTVMGLEIPHEMTGKSLVERKGK